jgi:hypothetical protein
MPLRRRRARGGGPGSNPDATTLFFATDLHGSETCFRKFVAAARFYGADLLVLGGDLTGKLVVPWSPSPAGAGGPGSTAASGSWTRPARPSWSVRPGSPAATPGGWTPTSTPGWRPTPAPSRPCSPS